MPIKKFVAVAALTLITLSTTFSGEAVVLNANEERNFKSPCTVESNVGNGETYSYEITAIIDNEIHGIPLNKKSCTNGGIFLLQDELSFSVGEGDKIEVIWGEYEDEFLSIKKIEGGR